MIGSSLGGKLFLVNLDITGSLNHTCMQINKNNITQKKKRKKCILTKPNLR